MIRQIRRLTRYDWRTALIVALSTFYACWLLRTMIIDGFGWNFVVAATDPLASHYFNREVTFYNGWWSHLGVLAWAVAAIAGIVAGRVCLARGERSLAAFLLAGGALSALLLLDDLVLLHEKVIPMLPRVPGTPAEYFVAVDAALAVAWAAIFRARLARDRDLPLLALAAGWLALSILLELRDADLIQEESAKLIGIWCWATFHWRVAIRSVLDTGLAPA